MMTSSIPFAPITLCDRPSMLYVGSSSQPNEIYDPPWLSFVFIGISWLESSDLVYLLDIPLKVRF
jgi:hypothetical protein